MEAFERESIMLDMKIAKPGAILKVKFGEKDVTPGIVLTPTEAQKSPLVSWDADSSSFYTLIMHDLDAPSRAEPKFREWQHWVVTNIPGCDVGAGQVLSEYVGAGPPRSTKLHRYVLLVYRQPAKLQFSEPRLTNRSSEGRKSHCITKMAAKYSLQGPIAANFFQAEFDDYCPKLYRQLSGK